MQDKIIEEFLYESNLIEDVKDEDSFEKAKLAWKFLASKEKLTHSVIKKTHSILMKNQRLEDKYKGSYRDIPVFIGSNKVTYLNIDKNLDKWLDDMNVSNPSTLERAGKNNLENFSKKLHIEYEKIHPFVDGNGRTGRMFMNWFRLKIGLPIIIIRHGEEQIAYYKWFK